MTNEERQKYLDRYSVAAHRMQSGVAAMMNVDASDTTPKHLRVGVNSALVEQSALGRLLIKKGTITEEEYWESLCAVMEEEVEKYEAMLSAAYGSNITLG